MPIKEKIKVFTIQEQLDAVAFEEKRRKQIRETEDKVKAENSLIEFLKLGWHVLEPGTTFVPGWHLDAIAEHLEAVSNGHIRNLLINCPPRFSKSLLTSVFWPCWVWLKMPSKRWLYSSYAQSLATRDSLKCRRLIQSPWFQERWSDRFKLTSDQNAKVRFDNNCMGYRLATSVGGSATGEGGSFVVCLPYDAKISTINGQKEIGNIVETLDKTPVLCYNHTTNQVEHKDIISWQKNPPKDLIEIELEDGKVLKCTLDHQVWTVNRGYVEAQHLTEMDEVLIEE